MTDNDTLKAVLRDTLLIAKVELSNYQYPVIMRKGTNDFGKTVRYFFNYSEKEQEVVYDYRTGTELLLADTVENGEILKMPAWGVKIVEE